MKMMQFLTREAESICGTRTKGKGLHFLSWFIMIILVVANKCDALQLFPFTRNCKAMETELKSIYSAADATSSSSPTVLRMATTYSNNDNVDGEDLDTSGQYNNDNEDFQQQQSHYKRRKSHSLGRLGGRRRTRKQTTMIQTKKQPSKSWISGSATGVAAIVLFLLLSIPFYNNDKPITSNSFYYYYSYSYSSYSSRSNSMGLGDTTTTKSYTSSMKTNLPNIMLLQEPRAQDNNNDINSLQQLRQNQFLQDQQQQQQTIEELRNEYLDDYIDRKVIRSLLEDLYDDSWE